MKSLVEQSLTEIWSFILSRKGIGANDNFFSLGGNSLLALATIEQIKQRLGWKLTLGDLLRHPTVGDLAANGPRASAINDERALIRMSSRGSKTPIIFIHPVSGLVFSYSKFVHELGRDRGCYGIQSPLLTGAELPATIEEIAEFYADMIYDEFAEEKFHLVGWSLGGLISYEIAKCAADKGLNLQNIVLIDSYIWEEPIFSWDEEMLVREFRNDLLSQVSTELQAGNAEAVTAATAVQDVACALFGHAADSWGGAETEFVERLLQAYIANSRTLAIYRPSAAPVRGLLLHASDNDSLEIWQKLSRGEMKFNPIACDHYGLLREQHAPMIASLIEDYLR